MKTISDHLIAKLYTWTVQDVNQIFDSCFKWNPDPNFMRYEGPSSTFSMMLAALMDTWGSIINDDFGQNRPKVTDKNVKTMLRKICELDEGKNKKYYEIFEEDNDTIKSQITELFRHNLIHNFGKKPKGIEFDLNIDALGQAINQQDDGRWHINCKKIKEDLLNVLRVNLPDLLGK